MTKKNNTSFKEELSQNRLFLMGLAMIAIILFHQDLLGVPRSLFRFGFYGVDIFLLISGFGCTFAVQKYTHKKFWARRFKRLLPTCIWLGALIVAIDLYFNVDDKTFPVYFRFFSLDKWYIAAIILYYLLTPFFYKIIKAKKNKGLFTLIIVGIIIALCLQIIQWYAPVNPEYEGVFNLVITRINWIIWRLPVYLIGVYICLYDMKITKRQYILSIIALIISIITLHYENDFLAVWPYFIAAAMPGLCSLLCRLRGWFIKIHLYRPVEIIGLYSLEVFLIHVYLLRVLQAQKMPVPGIVRFTIFSVLLIIFVYASKLALDFIMSFFEKRNKQKQD